MLKFDAVLKKLESETQAKRADNLQTCQAKEQQLHDETAKVSSQSNKFTKVLTNVGGVLNLEGSKSG